MIPYERRLQMLQLLEQKEIVSLEAFLKDLQNVSESTIRRDLKTLAAEGQITLLRGGGACLKKGSYEIPVNSKTIQFVSEKEKIARYAASMVKDGEAIYLDSGSTALRMVKHLRNKQVTIVTTNALIFSELQETNMNCFMVGGEINISTASISGTITNTMLESNYFDKAFIGASGFSMVAGINTPDMREAEKKRIVKKNSAEAFILADGSKDGKSTLCKIFELGEVPIICDKSSDLLISTGNFILAK
ncbi:MAG: DeoR/GlpR family DNA-binding transcription regulator [Lachnospiraceae bacterium]|nr:DeoR/GlpR family DNA-binding transcription regulator [Lachnospiraceae bacterium]